MFIKYSLIPIASRESDDPKYMRFAAKKTPLEDKTKTRRLGNLKIWCNLICRILGCMDSSWNYCGS